MPQTPCHVPRHRRGRPPPCPWSSPALAQGSPMAADMVAGLPGGQEAEGVGVWRSMNVIYYLHINTLYKRTPFDFGTNIIQLEKGQCHSVDGMPPPP